MVSRRQTRDGSFTLFSDRYNQTFHSMHGGHTEALHVFLAGTDIDTHIKSAQQSSVLEIGFGTGLNFFLTADLALTHHTALTFWSLEQSLLTGQVISTLGFEQLIVHTDLIEAFIIWRNNLPDDLPPGLLRWDYSDSLSLCLLMGDATAVDLPNSPVHAVYLDAFSPDQNPELWTIPFLKKLFKVLTPGGKLATYSAKSLVRKNLIAAGFETRKQQGPPGKREMLVGQRTT